MLRSLPLLSLSLCLVALLPACQRETAVAAPAPAPKVEAAPALAESGAISTGKDGGKKSKVDLSKTTDWPDVELTPGVAWLGCELDYDQYGDGQPLEQLDFRSLTEAVTPCRETGVLRVHYTGKINGEFTHLMERVSNVAKRQEINERVLDISSSGGQVEDAIRAGDVIGASNWTIWVRENGICHSSCVLILAAGDQRVIAGKVGIHRMIRINSNATSRGELSQELREVYAQLKDYLERNGAAVAVADLMMTVPNRKLRLLDDTELQEYGLQGGNAAQDDLDRIRLTRECGDDFVRRRDEFMFAFTRECSTQDVALEEMNVCGLALRTRFGFPDSKCPEESPLAEFDRRWSARQAQRAAEQAQATPTAEAEKEEGTNAGIEAEARVRPQHGQGKPGRSEPVELARQADDASPPAERATQ